MSTYAGTPIKLNERPRIKNKAAIAAKWITNGAAAKPMVATATQATIHRRQRTLGAQKGAVTYTRTAARLEEDPSIPSRAGSILKASDSAPINIGSKFTKSKEVATI